MLIPKVWYYHLSKLKRIVESMDPTAYNKVTARFPLFGCFLRIAGNCRNIFEIGTCPSINADYNACLHVSNIVDKIAHLPRRDTLQAVQPFLLELINNEFSDFLQIFTGRL